MKWNGIFKRYFGKVSPAPGTRVEPKTVTPAKKPSRPDSHDKYQEPAYLALAEQCAMGDIVAMLELARWHRSKLPPEGEQALAVYETDPEALGPLLQYLQDNRYNEQCLLCRYYITWVYRAALYGNAEAQALVDRCPRYAHLGLLNKQFYERPSYSSQHFYSSELNQLGLLGIRPDLDEFNLYVLNKDGFYTAYFLADYIPADSDGFGREDSYEDIFYDEFFNCLEADTVDQARLDVEQQRKKREAYWADPVHDREHRMYKRLLSERAEG